MDETRPGPMADRRTSQRLDRCASASIPSDCPRSCAVQDTRKIPAQTALKSGGVGGALLNFDTGVVTGFTGITARIDEVNANSVLFTGTAIHPSGTEWSVHG